MASARDALFAGITQSITPTPALPIVGGFPSLLAGVQTAMSPLPAGVLPPIPIGLDVGMPAARVTDEMLLQAITVSQDAFNRYAMMSPRFNPDALIQNKGWDEIDNLKTMAVYDSPLRLLKYTTLYKPMSTLPACNGKVVSSKHPRYDAAMHAADLCQYVINNIFDPDNREWTDFRTTLWYLLDACHSGFNVQEIVWRVFADGPYQGKLGFERFVPRRCKQIGYRLHPYSNKVLDLVNFSPVAGFQPYLPLEKVLLYVFQPRDGLPYGWGNGRTAYKHIHLINENIRTWDIALKRFGTGFLKAEISNPSDDYIKKVREMLDNVANGGSLVVPQGMKIDLMNLPGGALDVFGKSIELHEDQVIKAILGQSLTTKQGDGAGSYALGDIQQDTEQYFTGFPRTDIEMLVRNQVYARIVEYNLGVDYKDVIPIHSQGAWNIKERLALSKFYETFLKYAVVEPDEPFLRQETGIPPLDTTQPDADADRELALAA